MPAPSKPGAAASQQLAKRCATPPDPGPTSQRRPASAARPDRARLLVALAACAAICLGGCQRPVTRKAAPAEPNVAVAGHVTQIVDGDTIVVRIGDRTETVRLLGIDTPEPPGGPRPAECFGAEASEFAAQLLPIDAVVTLTRDQETRDVYGRLLAFVHRSSDGAFINLAMLETGHASPLFIAPNGAMEADFTAAADRARRDWIGFWPACGAADVTLSPDDPDP